MTTPMTYLAASPRSHSRPCRAGNALVIALGLLALIAVAVTVSTDDAISVHGETFRRNHQNAALAAVDAILARREGTLTTASGSGSLRTWTGGVPGDIRLNEEGQPTRNNYGVDYVGQCAVLWKIEPVHSLAKSLDQTGTNIPFVQNPSPRTGYVATAPEVLNDYTYLYRISAEARVLPDASTDLPLGRAQGERVLSLSGEPLFRYAIFYAKDGVKGDLELSAGPPITIRGGVYSNGAIYLGSGTNASDWGSLRPLAGSTTIGPDMAGGTVRVVGVDGIFRLSKPVMYSAFNFLGRMNGSNPGFAAGSAYQLGGAFPERSDPDGVDASSGSTFAIATRNGTHINPYRVTNSSRLATTNAPAVNLRVINGVAITGDTNSTTGNDSRDQARIDSQKWNPASLSTWNRRALSRVTNARKQSLPENMRNRPLEAQALVYGSVGGAGGSDDPTDDQDEHLEAYPMFVNNATGARVPFAAADDFPGANLSQVELPGTYLAYAMGDVNAHFVRKTPFTGWEIHYLGNAAAAPPAQRAGLIIRERPVPDLSYFMSGGAVTDMVPANESNRAYLPFAYGKHKRPYLMPFTPMFLTNRQTWNGSWDTSWGLVADSGTDGSPAVMNQDYFHGGHVRVRCVNDSNSGARDQSPDDPAGYHRTNMRLIHLKAPVEPVPASGEYPTRVNLNDPSAYFAKSDFESVQTRITSISGGHAVADATGRKMGLMIMPVDRSQFPVTGTHLYEFGLNSRRPYAAMFYSPERGFFSQRRLTHSEPVTVGDIFTNTGTGFDQPGTATLYRSSPIETRRQYNNNASRLGEPMTPITINTGEGVFTFYGGSYPRTVSETGSVKRHQIAYNVTLSNPLPGSFQLADAGRGITIYLDPPLAGPPPVAGTTMPETWIESYIDANTVRVVQKYEETNQYGSSDSITVTRTVSDNTIIKWHRDGNGNPAIKGAWNAAVAAFNGDEAALIAALEGQIYDAGANIYYQVDVSIPIDPDPSETYPSPPDLTAAEIPEIGTSAASPKARTFALPRGAVLDTNSYISQRGAWYDVPPASTDPYTPSAQQFPVKQYLPSAPIAPTTFPLTSSFRPDCFTGSSGNYLAPAYGDPPTSVVGDPWADAPIGRWTNGDNYFPGDVVQCDSLMYTCATGHIADALTRPLSIDPAWSTFWTSADSLWVRLEKQGDVLYFKYYVGSDSNPTPGQFIEMEDGWGNPSRATITDWDEDWVVALASQSGRTDNLLSVTYSSISITTSLASPDDVINRDDWEERVDPAKPNDWTKYMASQYQVFWGTRKITEDFMAFNEDDGPDERPATEEWFYNPREFWSQPRWWNEGDRDPITNALLPRSQWIEKETGNPIDVPNGENNENWTYWRRMMARSSVLDLNMDKVQNYIRTRTLTQATSDRWGFGTPAMAGVGGGLLRSSFSGLIYAVRTNRYPWNPNRVVPDGTVDPVDLNPFNPELPNTANIHGANYVPLTDTRLVFEVASGGALGQSILGTTLAPNTSALPIRPFDFHHGVKISNGRRLFWAAPGAWNASGVTFVTPNQLYLQGNLNTVPVLDAGGLPRTVPMAVMGDTITLLSNKWSLANFQRDGLDMDNMDVNRGGGGYANGGALAGGFFEIPNDWNSYRASDTTYNACIVTNNQPTTRDRIRLGEGAPFVNTLLFLENWSSRSMNYTGSLVVLDSARYTRGYLLEQGKTFGRGPLGVIGWTSTIAEFNGGGTSGPDWGANVGAMPIVYRPPNRNMNFNNDLLLREGTPPFAPYSFSINGIASWSRPTQ